MTLPYIPHTDHDRRMMLKRIGVSSAEQLITIPPSLQLSTAPPLPPAVSEIELMRDVRCRARGNRSMDEYASFLGAGIYDHFIPAVVESLASRTEFVTPYTPYQPEASQGTLQALYEYQSLICDLFEMDVANASVYDGATALAEAALLAARVTRRSRLIIAGNLHPRYRAVLKTYLAPSGLSTVSLPYSATGTCDLAWLGNHLDDSVAAVLMQSPNFFGYIEPMDEIGDILQQAPSLLVVSVDPISLGLLRPPGSYGADLAVAEGQSLGNDPYWGGATLGIFTARQEFLRQVPGRIVGRTHDREGEPGYVLILQTREQHIRRERATSNICTNHSLNALRAALYLAALGPQGLGEVARVCLENAHYLRDRLVTLPGFEVPFSGPFFKEFVIRPARPAQQVLRVLWEHGIAGGVELTPLFSELENCVLVCATEMRTKQEMDKFVRIVRGIN